MQQLQEDLTSAETAGRFLEAETEDTEGPNPGELMNEVARVRSSMTKAEKSLADLIKRDQDNQQLKP